ncbi:NAD(P)-binding protein [Mycena belliarum]|uniref:NAD(P)-binding protein n=1 Tax=Mycena belliarum TaxID=1033014 RepID=A0AAD6TXG2_9AGAR|nr:NAD(P)-binding protein [Mycena belliae]
MSTPSSPPSSSGSKVVLVMLATGKQGGGVVRALAEANCAVPEGQPLPYTIFAQTRSASSAKSRALAALPGVRTIEGTADAPETLFDAAGHVDAVFSVQLGLDNPKGLAGEFVQACALADAAAAHGVSHFVYTGANLGAQEKTGVPHLEVKRQVEAYLRTTHPTLPCTFLRPVTFMDQLLPGPSTVERVTTIMFLCQLSPNTRLQLVASSDIGRVAAVAFAAPEKWVGRVVDVAGDALTPREMESGWRTVMEREMRPNMMGGSALSWAIKNATRDLRLMFKFFNDVGYNADVAAAREVYPDMKDWTTFLRSEVKTDA